MLLPLLLFVFLSTQGTALAAADEAERKERIVVQTDSGPVSGVIGDKPYASHCGASPLSHYTPPSWLEVASFYGIPFAEEPTAALRFKPPKPRASWAPDVFDAGAPGYVCPQPPLFGEAPPWVPHWAGWGTHEDCLRLNVWTRGNRSGDGLHFPDGLRPVMAWIFPGGFVSGNSYTQLGCPLYTGQPWAADEGLVVVSMNYRLGFLGFMDLPELNAEGTSGNYGIQDQRLALNWVQRNIKAFGGDPARVTIMGESSGAASVLYHTVLPRSQGLFSRAIVESGYDNTYHEGNPEQRNSQAFGRFFRDALKCPPSPAELTLQCLRNASIDKVLDAQEKLIENMTFIQKLMAFAPTADGYELPKGASLFSELEKRKPKVPLLIGSNLNETALFFCAHLKEDMDYKGAVDFVREFAQDRNPRNYTDKDIEDLLTHYPVGPGAFPSYRSAVIGLSTDSFFTCGTRHVLRSISSPESEIYRYVLGRSPSPVRSADKAAKCLGVPHILDVIYVFGTGLLEPLGVMKRLLFDAGDEELVKAMSGAWTAFARGGAPSLPESMGVSEWPKWNNSAEPLLYLDSPMRVESGYQVSACEALESAGLVTISSEVDAASIVI